jgi:hypothetical protein
MNLLAELGRHPLRIQRRRTEGWRKPEGAVAITRPGVFGNPFFTAGSFERWILHGEIALTDLRPQGMIPWCDESKERLRQKREVIRERLPQLRGKQLMCFCGVGQACHGDVLARMANRFSIEVYVTPEMFYDSTGVATQYLEHCFRRACEHRLIVATGAVGWRFVTEDKDGGGLVEVYADTLPIDFKQDESDNE